MLPGYGFGDFVRIIELARQVVSDCRNAPVNFREVREIALNLCVLLQRVEKEAEKPESVFQRDRELVDELNALVRPCEAPLIALGEIVMKFNSLRSSWSARTIDRFRFPQGKILDIRGLLLVHIENLTLFLVNSGLSSIVRIESTVNVLSKNFDYVDDSVNDIRGGICRIESDQKTILQAVEKIGARNRLERNAGSVLSDHANDEKQEWKDLRTLLIRAGFTSRHISRHKRAIKDLLAELVEHDLQGSEAGSEVTSSTRDIHGVPLAAASDAGRRKSRDWTSMGAVMGTKLDSALPQRERSPVQESVYSRCHNDRVSRHVSSDVRGQQDAENLSPGYAGEYTAYSSIINGREARSKESDGNESTSNDVPILATVVERREPHDMDHGPLRRVPHRLPSQKRDSISTSKRSKESLSSSENNSEQEELLQMPDLSYESVRSRLDAGMDPNDCYGEHSYLCMTADLDDAKLTRLLLEHHADPNATCPSDMCLHHPIFAALLKPSFECVQAMLDYGVKINLRSLSGHTLLMFAVVLEEVQIVELLLDRGASVHLSDKNGSNSLHIAASLCENVRIVQLLLQFGANMEILTQDGATALHIAADRGRAATIELLLRKGANKDALTSVGVSALYLAAHNGHSNVVKLLLEYDAEIYTESVLWRYSTLHIAAYRGHEEVVRLFLDYVPDPNRPSQSGAGSHTTEKVRPLHLAAINGHTAIVSLLLEHGADIDATLFGISAVQFAWYKKHSEVADLLLAKGALASNDILRERRRARRSKS